MFQLLDTVDGSASIAAAASDVPARPAGRLLISRRTDSGLYALPGGRHELGETMTETTVRETLEETGVTIEITCPSGSTPIPPISSPSPTARSGRSSRSCFRPRRISGEPRPSDEPSEVQWIPRDQLDALDVRPSIRLRINHGYADRSPHYTSPLRPTSSIHERARDTAAPRSSSPTSSARLT